MAGVQNSAGYPSKEASLAPDQTEKFGCRDSTSAGQRPELKRETKLEGSWRDVAPCVVESVSIEAF